MDYRQQIEHQLALRQTALELALAKANEQEPFVRSVADVLSRLAWPYRMTVDKDFNVCFTVERGLTGFACQYQAVSQALAERFEVSSDRGGLAVESCRRPWGACRVVFGEAA